MSESSKISSPINLEFLRKEAKALLRQCRAGDTAALSRLGSQLHRLGSEFRLADVQHALARESGHASWADLKQHLAKSRYDYTQPGDDGVLPTGYKEWKRGATYTVRPEMLSPLMVGKVYRLLVGVHRNGAPVKGPFTYADIYQRATAIAKGRIRELRCVDETRTLHTWILQHAWFPMKVKTAEWPVAFVSMGILYPSDDDVRPQGQRPPSLEELQAAGGLTPDQITPETKIPSPEESFVDFSESDPSDPHSNIAMFSYGEYVASVDGLNFEPVVRRAERRTRSYWRFTRRDDSVHGALSIVRRQWFCATNPDIAVVHIYFRA
jgi:hypothetical protein